MLYLGRRSVSAASLINKQHLKRGLLWILYWILNLHGSWVKKQQQSATLESPRPDQQWRHEESGWALILSENSTLRISTLPFVYVILRVSNHSAEEPVDHPCSVVAQYIFDACSYSRSCICSTRNRSLAFAFAEVGKQKHLLGILHPRRAGTEAKYLVVNDSSSHRLRRAIQSVTGNKEPKPASHSPIPIICQCQSSLGSRFMLLASSVHSAHGMSYLIRSGLHRICVELLKQTWGFDYNQEN